MVRSFASPAMEVRMCSTGLVGYIRLKRPAQVVALAMQSDGGCHTSLRLSRRYDDISEFRPLVSSDIMAFVLTKFGGIEALYLWHLQVSWQVPEVSRCEVVDFGEATSLMAGGVVHHAGVADDRDARAGGAAPEEDALGAHIAAGFACIHGLGTPHRAAAQPPLKAAKALRKKLKGDDHGLIDDGNDSMETTASDPIQ